MPIDENEPQSSVVPASERWKLFREMIKEPDDTRRQELIREYYRRVTRDMVARYRELDGDRDER